MTTSTVLIDALAWLIVGIAAVLAWAIAFFWYRDRARGNRP